jgi:hypothetical protein
MGIYYNSYYYPDVNQKSKRIRLGSMDPVLDKTDKERGYVRKEELFRIFARHLNKTPFGENSYIVVYSWSTYGDRDTEIETERLRVLDK